MTCSLTYEEWNRLNAAYLIRIEGKTAIVAFSGGKDSSVTLDLLKRAADEYGFEIEAHGGIFPAHVLTIEQRKQIDEFWKARSVPIEWHRVAVPDRELDKAVSEGNDPCRICNQAKKTSILQDFALKGQNLGSVVVIVGYSLWDIVSAVIEHILAARFQPQEIEFENPDSRLEARRLETFQRFYPWMVFPSGLTVYKPLNLYNDQEIEAYVADKRLLISEIQCRFKDWRPKRILAHYYNRMQLTFDYERVLAFVRNTLDLPEAAEFENGDEKEYLKNFL